MDLRILIVDDEIENLQSLGEALAALGAESVKARDGEEAWARLDKKAARFDLVITDLQMPSLDGLGLLRRIASRDLPVPVAIITGRGDLASAVEAMKLRAFDYLLKPYRLRDLDELLQRVQTFLAPGTGGMGELLPAGFSEEMRLTVPPRRELVRSTVVHCAQHFSLMLRNWGLQEQALRLCLSEALSNAIIHGALGVSSDLKEDDWAEFNKLVEERERTRVGTRYLVEICVRLSAQQLEIVVTDPGDGFDYQALPNAMDPTTLMVSGRGILLIRNAMDEVFWNEKGNAITMRKSLQLGGNSAREPAGAEPAA